MVVKYFPIGLPCLTVNVTSCEPWAKMVPDAGLASNHDGSSVNDHVWSATPLFDSVAVKLPLHPAVTLGVTSAVFQLSVFCFTTKLQVMGLPTLVCRS